MSADNNDYFGVTSDKSRLVADGLLLMTKGAGYALLFCLSVWFVIAVFWGIGVFLLPEDRIDMPDPVNRGWNDAMVVVIDEVTPT